MSGRGTNRGRQRSRPAARALLQASALAIALCGSLPAAVGLAPGRAVADEGAGSGPAATAAKDPALVACAENVARKVQSRYESIHDLRADFEQVTQSVSLGSGALADDSPVKGEVVFAKPGRMRWTYREPAPSVMVSDGRTLWLYDPVAKEASRLPVDRGYLSGAALQFLMGEGDVLETFEVVAEQCDPGSDAAVELELLPREPASYERMALRADPETGLIDETTIVDLFGNETTIRFSDVRTDTGVASGTFAFEPPDGVKVVDLVTPP